jgi:anti-sigma factor RsiW
MDCERIETRLIAWLDGRASKAERHEVEEHLRACEACRLRAEEFRQLWGVLDEMPTVEASPAFDARLRARMAVEPPRASLWSWLIPSPRLAFAVTALLLLSVWISSLPPANLPPPPASTDAEFKMINDLPVLENYDVLANFEVLSELPPNAGAEHREM